MNYKWRYTIFICSVILGEHEPVFSKLQGLQYYFPEMFRCNLMYYKSKNFSDSSLHYILNPKLLGFLFTTKNSQTGGVKFEIKLKKNVGNLLDKLRKLYINGTVIIFGRPQIIENSSQHLRLRKIVS